LTKVDLSLIFNGILISNFVGQRPDLNKEAEPHDVAGLLKLYFRELPEPLLTFEMYEPFLVAAGRSSHNYANLSIILFSSRINSIFDFQKCLI